MPGARLEVTEVHRDYWLSVEPAEEKSIHRLVPRDVEVSPPQYAALADPVPAVRFDDEGAFLGIDIPEELPGQQLLDALPMEPEKKAEIVKNLVAVQEQSAREYWERLVGSWRGVTLVPGDVETQPVGQSESGEGPMARKRFELVRVMRMDRVDWGEDGGAQPLKEFLQVEEYVYTYGAQRVPPGSTSL